MNLFLIMFVHVCNFVLLFISKATGLKFQYIYETTVLTTTINWLQMGTEFFSNCLHLLFHLAKAD